MKEDKVLDILRAKARPRRPARIICYRVGGDIWDIQVNRKFVKTLVGSRAEIEAAAHELGRKLNKVYVVEVMDG